MYYLDQTGIKSEDFRTKQKQNQKAWQVLELVHDSRKQIIEPFQSIYFEIERKQLKNFIDSTVKIKCQSLEINIQNYDDELVYKSITAQHK